MAEVDILAEREISRYYAGMAHGIRVMLGEEPGQEPDRRRGDPPRLPLGAEALQAMALELTLLRAAYAVATDELAKARRTIAAYRTIIHG